jgi:hypothetical protein
VDGKWWAGMPGARRGLEPHSPGPALCARAAAAACASAALAPARAWSWNPTSVFLIRSSDAFISFWPSPSPCDAVRLIVGNSTWGEGGRRRRGGRGGVRGRGRAREASGRAWRFPCSGTAAGWRHAWRRPAWRRRPRGMAAPRAAGRRPRARPSSPPAPAAPPPCSSWAAARAAAAPPPPAAASPRGAAQRRGASARSAARGRRPPRRAAPGAPRAVVIASSSCRGADEGVPSPGGSPRGRVGGGASPVRAARRAFSAMLRRLGWRAEWEPLDTAGAGPPRRRISPPPRALPVPRRAARTARAAPRRSLPALDTTQTWVRLHTRPRCLLDRPGLAGEGGLGGRRRRGGNSRRRRQCGTSRAETAKGGKKGPGGGTKRKGARPRGRPPRARGGAAAGGGGKGGAGAARGCCALVRAPVACAGRWPALRLGYRGSGRRRPRGIVNVPRGIGAEAGRFAPRPGPAEAMLVDHSGGSQKCRMGPRRPGMRWRRARRAPEGGRAQGVAPGMGGVQGRGEGLRAALRQRGPLRGRVGRCRASRRAGGRCRLRAGQGANE